MDKVIGRLTVFFEDPFWVGVFERIENGRLSAAKVTFGAEPKEPELLIYLLRHYYRLQFSPAVETAVKPAHRNPKRAQQEAGRQTAQVGIGTKSQQALQLQQEQNKQMGMISLILGGIAAISLFGFMHSNSSKNAKSTKDISPLCFSFRLEEPEQVLHRDADARNSDPAAEAHENRLAAGLYQLDNVGIHADGRHRHNDK